MESTNVKEHCVLKADSIGRIVYFVKLEWLIERKLIHHLDSNDLEACNDNYSTDNRSENFGTKELGSWAVGCQLGSWQRATHENSNQKSKDVDVKELGVTDLGEVPVQDCDGHCLNHCVHCHEFENIDC